MFLIVFFFFFFFFNTYYLFTNLYFYFFGARFTLDVATPVKFAIAPITNFGLDLFVATIAAHVPAGVHRVR